MTASDKQQIQSVAVAHRLLAALGEETGGVSLAALARRVDMTPTRVFRHLATLVDLQLVERTGGEPLYRLGVALVRLGQQAADQHDVTRVAYQTLRELSDEFGQAVYLVRPHGGDAVVWLSFQSKDVPQVTMPPGMTFSLSGSACGRSMLAFLDQVPSTVSFASTRTHHHPDPIADELVLRNRLAEVRGRFFDYYGVEDANAIYSLAAPVLNHQETAVAAIGIIGFSAFLKDRQAELLAALLDASGRVSVTLGSRLERPASYTLPVPVSPPR